MRRPLVRVVVVLGAAVLGGAVLAQGPIKPLAQVPARSDANASLMVTVAPASGQAGPIAPLAQVNGRSDSNAYLYVTMAGGTATPDKICLDATNQDACLQRNGAGVLQLGNAATSTGFNRLQFGGSTASFSSWKGNGTQLDARLADDSNYANVAASVFIFASRLASSAGTVMSATAPTIASGGCTSPAVTWNNGTATFLITIGTSCTGVKTFTLTMPTSSNRWACDGQNNTSDAAQQTNYIVFRATSTTAVVGTSYDRTTNAQEDFTASDAYLIKCSGG